MSEVRRIWRSKEARGVRDALLAYAGRGLLHGFDAGKLRLGKMSFTVLPRVGRTYRLVLDVDAGTLHLSGLVPSLDERSELFKELKGLLLRISDDQFAPIQIEKGDLQWVQERAGLALAMRVRESEYEYCARRLMDCAKEISRIFPDPFSCPEEMRGARALCS